MNPAGFSREENCETMDENISNPRLIAFYLPQFHPIPENDEWWSKGFTEWTNVAKAKPLFKGHYQPHIPADVGFYDLRLAETREAQAEMAKEYGIYGFCYYHYWFKGKRLLNRPFDEVLASGKPGFPFCLCWANESWTRAWDGRSGEYLIKQSYCEEDDRRHIKWLVRVFQDKRYIRVGDRPLFLVYRASKLPDPVKTTAIWREEARKMGIRDIFLCRVESFPEERGDPTEMGFDAAVEFQPDWANLGTPLRRGKLWLLARKLGLSKGTYLTNSIYDYSSFVQRILQKSPPSYKRFPCVTPSWDNSPRRKRDAVIIHGSTPDLYGEWLQSVIEKSPLKAAEDNLIFINAWNEWGEGNHLEPCQKWGRAYLEGTRRSLMNSTLNGRG